MRRAVSLSLGAWALTSLLWLAAGLTSDEPNLASLGFQVLRATGFLLAMAALWTLRWVRRTTLAIGLLAVALADLGHFATSVVPGLTGLGLVMESGEALGAASFGVLGVVLLARRPVPLHWMAPGIALHGATAVYWSLSGSSDSLAFLPGNLVAIAATAWFLAIALRGPTLNYGDLPESPAPPSARPT